MIRINKKKRIQLFIQKESTFFSKDFYIVTFQINAVLFNFLFGKESLQNIFIICKTNNNLCINMSLLINIFLIDDLRN